MRDLALRRKVSLVSLKFAFGVVFSKLLLAFAGDCFCVDSHGALGHQLLEGGLVG